MTVLLVGSSSSNCADCYMSAKYGGASPSETGHETVLSYGPHNGAPGCGKKWDNYTFSTYGGWNAEQLEIIKEAFEMRHPHLKGRYIDYGSLLSGKVE